MSNSSHVMTPNRVRDLAPNKHPEIVMAKKTVPTQWSWWIWLNEKVWRSQLSNRKKTARKRKGGMYQSNRQKGVVMKTEYDGERILRVRKDKATVRSSKVRQIKMPKGRAVKPAAEPTVIKRGLISLMNILLSAAALCSDLIPYKERDSASAAEDFTSGNANKKHIHPLPYKPLQNTQQNVPVAFVGVRTTTDGLLLPSTSITADHISTPRWMQPLENATASVWCC